MLEIEPSRDTGFFGFLRDVFSDFASKPSSIIYLGISLLLIVSELKKPSDLTGLTYKVLMLVCSFIVVTVFNTQYFKYYWRFYTKKSRLLINKEEGSIKEKPKKRKKNR